MSNKILFFFLLLHPIYCLEKFLIFTRNKNVVETKYVYELYRTKVDIDAYLNEPVLVKYIQLLVDFNFPTINFYCQVKTVDQKNEIDLAYLCKKDSLSSTEDCHVVNKGTVSVKFGDIMTFNIDFNPATGFTASLNMETDLLKDRRKPFDGFFFCRLLNPFSKAQSNYIEIQDYEFYKKKISLLMSPLSKAYEPTPIKEIKDDNLPIFLDCGKAVGDGKQDFPKWASDNLNSPFVWKLCPGATTGIDCYSMLVDSRNNDKPLSEYLEYYQYSNGTIAILAVKNSKLTKSGMICIYNSYPIKLYAMYLTKNGNSWLPITFTKSSDNSRPIQPISPLYNDITIREGLYETVRFKLRASYVASSDHTKRSFTWLKNDMPCPQYMQAEAFELTFPSVITKEHGGKYTLTITQTGLTQSVQFEFNVKIVGIPIIKRSEWQPERVYCMVDRSVNLSVKYDVRASKKKLDINGCIINFSSNETKIANMISLSQTYPFLGGIDVFSNITDESINKDQVYVTYTATNLYKQASMPMAKTHTVTFIAENDVGESKLSILIRVYELPLFIHYVSSFNCTNNCQSNRPHLFKCLINDTEFIGEGLQVKYLWNLNKQNLNNMNDEYIHKSYMKITGDTVELKPISGETADDEKMAVILKDATLSCQVTISEPVKSGHNPPPSQIIYNSDDYPDLKQKLKAKIKLDLNVLAKGSSSWILPLIISLIVLVILVILILYFCLRGSGETYNVDQKERAQGYDPEKEIRDNETFQPYERDHDNNIMEPSRLSFNDEDSVGVGSDDGELDVYDIDPGKFNEEGSFIGQYASDPRKHKVANA